MEVLRNLQQNLNHINEIALSRLRPGDALGMRSERSRLAAWVQGSSRVESIPAATIEQALRRYREHKSLIGLRQIKLVCYGCTQQLDGEVLIENREPFERLLDYVEHYQRRQRPFRKLYRALLASYFSYEADASGGRGNRENLRRFLARHLQVFVLNAYTPGWLSLLTRYPALLDEHPGLSLLGAVMQGDWSVFNEIREQLELDAGSWLVRQMVMAPLDAVQHMEDASFKEQLNALLLLLNDYPLYAGAGLTLLLDRYVLCAERPVCATLRDFAYAQWGNPWLPAQQWRCSEAAREMLARWLKRQLLSEFFGLLSNDDTANPRRLNFWALYSADLNGMYFALGRDAYAAGNMALFKFRSHAKGLIAKFPEEKHDVHTCIMQFAHHHVVEFNRENNVAYFYDTRQGVPSFYFGKGWVEIGAIRAQDIAEGVEVARTSKPIRHQDSKELTWEGKFARELGVTENALAAFCDRYQCVFENLRNGNQWLRPAHPEHYGMEVWSVLLGWGFGWMQKEAAWYRSAR